jgi:hypothetical protein
MKAVVGAGILASIAAVSIAGTEAGAQAHKRIR